MATVAKAPAKKTSPVVWVAILGATAAAYFLLMPSDTPSAVGGGGAKTRRKTAKTDGIFTEEDMKAKFAVFTEPPADAFKPAITKPPKTVKLPVIEPAGQKPGGVPVALTGGEANWYYTGWNSLNGAREALLENTATGETVFLRPGDRWKSARIQSIDVSAVAMVGPDGAAIQVPIQQYGEVPGAAKAPLASNAPLAVPGAAIQGAIGGANVPGSIGVRPVGGPQTITLSNGQTLQLPPAMNSAGSAVSATQDPSQGNGRRRRRNRNQNFGDPNNGF